MWNTVKFVLLIGTGLGVLVFVAGGFQPGKNVGNRGLNFDNGQRGPADRFLRADEVGPLGTSRLEVHDGKLYQVTYKPGYGRPR